MAATWSLFNVLACLQLDEQYPTPSHFHFRVTAFCSWLLMVSVDVLRSHLDLAEAAWNPSLSSFGALHRVGGVASLYLHFLQWARCLTGQQRNPSCRLSSLPSSDPGQDGQQFHAQSHQVGVSLDGKLSICCKVGGIRELPS